MMRKPRTYQEMLAERARRLGITPAEAEVTHTPWLDIAAKRAAELGISLHEFLDYQAARARAAEPKPDK